MTFVEIRCPPGSPPAIATSLGGVGSPAGSYPLTQVANWLHTIDVSGLTGRWQFDIDGGNRGSRIVEMVDDGSTIKLGDNSTSYAITIPAIEADDIENGLDSEITRYRGTRWAIAVLGIAAHPAKLFCTVKRLNEPDAKAVLQAVVTNPPDAGDGLQVLLGQTAQNKGHATITVESYDDGGTTKYKATVVFEGAATAGIVANRYRIDFKEVDSPGVLGEAKLNVKDPVTDATS